MFGRSGRTVAARSKTHRFTTRETDFFAQRVLCYWNKLPADVKCSESVTSFKDKSRIDSFRLKGYKENRLGHFWELSYDIYDRVEVNLQLHDGMMYTSFMKKNPLIARVTAAFAISLI